VIGQPKLAYFADYHALHERENCAICEMQNANVFTYAVIYASVSCRPILWCKRSSVMYCISLC